MDWLSEVSYDFRVSVELPDEDGFVSGGSDEDLSVFIFFLGVSGFNGGDPVGVALEVSNLFGVDGTFFSHIHKFININQLNI